MLAVLVGSVIDQTYLAEARVLARSVLEHEPAARVCVLVVDAEPGAAGSEPFEVVTPADLGIDDREFARRAAMYPPQALVSSLKPVLVAHLLARARGPVVLLDADVLVLGDLAPLAEPARDHAIVLTPHDPHPAVHVPGVAGEEQTFLRAGVFNGGVLACGPGAEPFLQWWAQRTRRDCIVDLDHALLMSQTWLTLVPALFDHHVARDRSMNLMGHNLGGDDIDWGDPARPGAGGTAIRVSHFSGRFDPHAPLAIFDGPARHPWWPDARERPGLARLCEHYAQLLLAAGYDAEHARPRQLDVVGPLPLDQAMRHCYRAALIAAERGGAPEPPAPLTDGADAFLAWISAPAWDASPISRWLAALWELRADLRRTFPDPVGADADELARWAAEKGPAGTHGLPLAALNA